MACGKDDGIAAYLTTVGGTNTQHTAFMHDKVGHTASEMVLATGTLDGAAHIGDDAPQPVGADMGMHVDHDVGVGTVLHKALQHATHVATLGRAGVKLAVAEGTCPTLAETPVAVGVDSLLPWYAGNVAPPLLDGLPSFNNYGLYAKFNGP